MSRIDTVNRILRDLQTGTPDVEGCALVSEDGLMIASALPQHIDETRVAGMTATLANLGHRAADELEMHMALVGEILPSVLHELRNPLAAVTSVIENLVEEAEQDAGLAPHQQALHAVLHELRRMGLAFQGIGSVGRSLRGHRPGAADLAIEEACRLMSSRARRRDVALQCAVEPMPLLPLELGVVRAVTFNLVNNAIQACAPGDEVRVTAHLRGDTLRLDVLDTGRGMTPEIKARALQPFFTTRANGSGLGLVICHEAVVEAGGRLWIDSTTGQGTTISIEVPTTSPNSHLDQGGQ